MSERDEKNRVIARWLGWTTQPRRLSEGFVWYAPDGGVSLDPPNFYTDEAANALVLEKMPRPGISRGGGNYWSVVPDFTDLSIEAQDPDRKTAICEAALKLIEMTESSSANHPTPLGRKTKDPA